MLAAAVLLVLVVDDVEDDGKYECVDGQQRSISICEFVNNTYSIMYNNQPNYFYNLLILSFNNYVN